MIILDFGSGNSCLNDWQIAKEMIDALINVDSYTKNVVIKWQLFKEAGANVPLNRDIFKKAYWYAYMGGYRTTASVFDMESLSFLLGFEIPFVKIANNPKYYSLVNYIPQSMRVIKSVGKHENWTPGCMVCVSDYPADAELYELRFSVEQLQAGISDHTTDWYLYHKYQPAIYECHFCLPDSEGLDAGPFARRPEQLREIL